MIEGLDNDDKYVMVEDEFETVAKAFTRHLHHAEYSRLKKLAREQNAQSINNIVRPVDARTKIRQPTQKMMRQQSNTKMQNATIKGLLDVTKAATENPMDVESDSDTEGDPWVGTSLHGLMASPKHSQKLLSSLVDIESKTRATAGCSAAALRSSNPSWPLQSSQSASIQDSSQRRPVGDAGSTTEEEDDDNLDGPTERHAANSNTTVALASSIDENEIGRSNTRDSSGQSRSVKSSSRPPGTQRSLQPDSSTSLSNMTFSRDPDNTTTLVREVSFDDYPVPTQLRKGSSLGFKRRMINSRTDSSEEKLNRRDSAKLNEVPTFLL